MAVCKKWCFIKALGGIFLSVKHKAKRAQTPTHFSRLPPTHVRTIPKHSCHGRPIWARHGYGSIALDLISLCITYRKGGPISLSSWSKSVILFLMWAVRQTPLAQQGTSTTSPAAAYAIASCLINYLGTSHQQNKKTPIQPFIDPLVVPSCQEDDTTDQSQKFHGLAWNAFGEYGTNS